VHARFCLVSLAYVQANASSSSSASSTFNRNKSTILTTSELLRAPYTQQVLRITSLRSLRICWINLSTMAELPPPTLTILYPPPPPFYKDFTPENIAQIDELRVAQSGADPRTKQDHATSLAVRLLDLPPELRSLQPPEPPADGFYRCFGIDHSVRLQIGPRKCERHGGIHANISSNSPKKRN
jgi:hypothetical protein